MMGVGSSIVYTFKKESVGPTLSPTSPLLILSLITTTKTANTHNTTQHSITQLVQSLPK